MIQSSSRCLGILGSGISHSLSPLIHNYAAAQLGVDCVYLCFDSQSRQFPGADFFQTMWDVGALGFNVTVPFKEQAAQMFPGSSLASVNTLYRGEKFWQATSTDAEGFLLGLAQLNRNLDDHDAVVFLGNGGAALALYEHFLKVTTHPLIILRRTANRNAAWVKPQGRVEFLDLTAANLDAVCRRYPKNLLLQTTSAPLQGDRLDFLLPGLGAFQGAFVDLVYGKTSALLDYLRLKGLRTQDGLPMLIGQALLGQKLWWGQSAKFADVEAMLRSRVK
ncbi:MAG: hypothetical protein M3Q07_04570 [Pseudobdellovibrionaceae bacterium]|nr:hypothetical protein [Pseudobdellovibrionaceae bacterium]